MACGYMGCGTTSNRITWAVVAILVILAAVLIGVGTAGLVPCSRQRTTCLRQIEGTSGDKTPCSDAYRACARTHLIVACAGAAVFVLALSVICCMCCCSQPPGPKIPMATGPYNMSGIQLQPYSYPSATAVQQQYNSYSNPYQQQYNGYSPAFVQQQQQQQRQGYFVPTYTAA